MGGGYKIYDQFLPHFLTFTVVEWIDVFTRKLYCELLLNNFRYCQEAKGLLIHSWCLMTNHLHLVASSRDGNLSDIIRDFKKFSSRQLIEEISKNPRESRKRWMLPVFMKHGNNNSRNKTYQFWIQDNCPMELLLPRFTAQKIDYIHNNPVKAGIVRRPEDYLYSSAVNYEYRRCKGLLDIVFL
jgi:REP element-mobilizing transposase RayT